MADDYDREVIDAFFAQPAAPVVALASASRPSADGPPLPVQGALPLPPGFVGYLTQYILGQAMRPVPEVATVAALGIMAGLAGKQWVTFTETGLNLYIVLVARSGVGKEAMHDGIAAIRQAMAEQYPASANYFDFTEFASGPALTKACASNWCFLNVSSELGHRFRQMSIAKDGPMTTLRKILNQLYMKSSPRSVMGGIGYSEQEKNVDPTGGVAYSLLGESTPRTFYESVTDSMMEDGLMSRFLVIHYDGKRPPENTTRETAPPKEMVDWLSKIARHGELLFSQNKYLPVPADSDARQALDAFRDECDREIDAAGDDEWILQLWNRAHLKVLRVATLLAVGENPFGPHVTVGQVEWAITLVRHGNAEFLKRIRTGEVGEGSDGGREAKIREICRDFILPGAKVPHGLKNGKAMQDASIVPRNYLQTRTQRVAAFQKHKLGAKAALDLAINTALANGWLMEVKKDKLVEMFDFHGRAFRVLNSRD
ncbi:MAG: DUF3987 domain-containing protein [Sphingobium sp.]